MPFSTFALSASDGNEFSAYSPLTLPDTASEPEVCTDAKSRVYTAGTSERMCLNSVFGAPKARSSSIRSLAEVTLPEKARVSSLRRTPLSLRVKLCFARSAATSVLRSSRTFLR